MKKNKINKLKNKRGSILVYTLFLLSISLILGLSLIASSVTSRRSALSTGKSVHSFQVADSGLEYAFLKIREENFSGGSFVGVNSKKIEDVFGWPNCDSDGFIKYDTGQGIAEIYFYDDVPDQIDCDDSTKTFDDIKKIKSIGTHNGISRSVEAGGLDFPTP
ncbi:MAG: hypothetical protein V3574_05065 [Candidatus Moraniibacteriota bacterium]